MNRDKPDADKINPTGEEIRAAIDSLNAEYAESRRAYRIQQLAGGYVFATDKKFAVMGGKTFQGKSAAQAFSNGSGNARDHRLQTADHKIGRSNLSEE